MAWLSGYSYRVKVPCSHTTAGAQTLYQMQLAIIRGAGSNSAGTIYLNSHLLFVRRPMAAASRLIMVIEFMYHHI